jgi:hypothetical protein
VVGHHQPELGEQQLVVAEVGRAPGAAIDRVHQVHVAGRALADPVHHRDRAPVDHPGEHHLRVQVEASQPVAAHGAGVGAGGEHAAQAPTAVVHGGGHQFGADAATLVLGPDGERRQDPHQLADPRDRAADHLSVDLGHPAAPRVGDQRLPGPSDPVAVAGGGTSYGIGPGALVGAGVDLVVGRRGDLGERLEVLRPHRAHDRRGHDT